MPLIIQPCQQLSGKRSVPQNSTTPIKTFSYASPDPQSQARVDNNPPLKKLFDHRNHAQNRRFSSRKIEELLSHALVDDIS